MAIKYFEIDLDIKDPHIKMVPYIEVVSGDTDTNIFNIQLFENYIPVNASGHTAVITFGKPDKTTVFQNLTVVDATKGKYTCTLSSQTIAVPGTVKAEVSLYEGTKRLTSTRFQFIVRKAILDENTVESSNEFSALTEALSTVNQYDNRITSVEDTLGSHLEESIHQGKNNTLEATSTNDATSVTNAPLKSAGGLAVAKSAYVGGSPLSLVLGKGNYIRKYILNANADIPDLPIRLEEGKQLRITFATSYFEGFCLDIMYFNRYSSTNYEFCEKIFTGINANNQIRSLNAVNKVGINIPDENIIIDHQGSEYRFDLIIKPSRTSYIDNDWSVVIDSYGLTDYPGGHSPKIVSIIYEDIQIEEG